jgi:hypothetical protein
MQIEEDFAAVRSSARQVLTSLSALALAHATSFENEMREKLGTLLAAVFLGLFGLLGAVVALTLGGFALASALSAGGSSLSEHEALALVAGITLFVVIGLMVAAFQLLQRVTKASLESLSSLKESAFYVLREV